MGSFFYKKNVGVHVGSFVSVKDITSIFPYTENLSIGDSTYTYSDYRIDWSTSGSYLTPSGSSSTAPFKTYDNSITPRCVSGSRAKSSSNAYAATVVNAFQRLAATSFSFSPETPDSLILCSSTGSELASVEYTYVAPSNHRIGYTLASGGSMYATFYFSSVDSLSVKLVCEGERLFLLILVRGTTSAMYDVAQLTVFSYEFKTYDMTPLYYSLFSSNALYPDASGSSDGDSIGSGGGSGIYEFVGEDISSDDDIGGSSPAIATGLVNPYYVTASEISALGNFLWSSDFFDSIAKTFSNPMDCIISLSSFPVSSSSMSLGSSESVRVGNTTSSSTGTRLISEFVTIDCGSVSVPEVWGSYLDYAQTKLYIYIPYLGIEELPLCECMGGSVACKLRINLLTGALVACLTLTSGTYVTGSARVQPIYFSTTCKNDIPVSGATTGALAGAFQLLGGAVSTVAGIASGTAPVAVAGLASAAQGVATMQSQNSQISGAVGAAGGQMAHKTPFLIFDRPVQSVPANLASVAGYQSNAGTTLSRCSGYVICDTINLDGISLTRSELEEVEQICTSGVYIS